MALAQGSQLLNPQTPTFMDVPSSMAFYSYVETAYAHGVISGYSCGGPLDPCAPSNRPYFHPGGSATRGQIAHMIYKAITSP